MLKDLALCLEFAAPSPREVPVVLSSRPPVSSTEFLLQCHTVRLIPYTVTLYVHVCMYYPPPGSRTGKKATFGVPLSADVSLLGRQYESHGSSSRESGPVLLLEKLLLRPMVPSMRHCWSCVWLENHVVDAATQQPSSGRGRAVKFLI